MSKDEGWVYWIVCLRIYETNGPCRDTLDAIAHRTKVNRRRVSDILDRLFRTGKLVRVGDGIMNPFAETIITERITRFQEAQSAGKKGAEKRWGKDKQKQRKVDGVPHSHPTQPPLGFDAHLHLHTDLEKKVRKKKDTAPAKAVALNDDWPDNYEDQFWDKFPKGRRHDQAAVYGYLFKLRRDGFIDAKKKRQRLTWAVLMAGLDLYVASDPGEFAKAPLPWLRGQRWAVTEYPIKGLSNGNGNHGRGLTGDDAILAAARRRTGNGGGLGGAPRTAAPVSSGVRVHHEAGSPGGGGSVILDLKPNG